MQRNWWDSDPTKDQLANPYAITQPQTQSQVQQQQATGLGMDRTRQEMAKGANDLAVQPEMNAADLENKRLQAEKNRIDVQNPGGDVQGMTAGFYGRALYANHRYGKGVPPRDPATQMLVDIAPTGIVNSMTGKDRQQADTFAKDFIAATLRKESGAAISPQEYQGQYERYFPMPGDTDQTIASKARLRETAIAGLRAAAGPLADRTDTQIRAMLEQDQQNAPPPSEHSVAGFGLQEQPKLPGAEDYRNGLYGAMKGGHINSYKDALAFTEQFNQQHGTHIAPPVNDKGFFNAIAAAKKGRAFNVELPQYDARTQQLVEDMKGNAGRGTAFKHGAKDAISLGGGDEIKGAVDALGQSLRGEGSFGDLYGVNRDAQRAYDDYLQQSHPGFYMGGQLAGSLAIPSFGATSAMDMAKLGAGVGGAYGFNSSNGNIGDRLVNAGESAAAGGALGYAIPKSLGLFQRRAPEAVPPLVDPQTGQLNQPMEAMTPGQRVLRAEEYGINLPADAAGGRTAAVMGKGLDINPGSAGVMEDARRATESQVAAASDVVASRFGQARTMNEAGSELQRGANERIERGKSVISKAYDAIPIADQSPATTQNSIATLQQLVGRFQSNPDLAQMMQDPKLAGYQAALEKGGLSWKDLKDFRSIIGEKIGEMRFGESSSTSDLRALYAGLSEDMKNTAAAHPGGLRAFDRANNLNRQNEELIQGALTRILGRDGTLAPERAAAAVQAMTKGGKSTGDLRTLSQIRAATVKSGAWNEIASTLIRLGGQPANSAGRDFNPQTFVNWYADMAEPARKMLFGGENHDLRKALDGFVAVNQRLQKVNALRNTSNTAGGLVAAGTATAMTAPVTMALMGHPGMAATTAGAGVLTGLGGYASAKLWTNPAVVRFFTGYARAAASGNPAAVRSQIGRLQTLATTNPALREPLLALQQRLANDNFAHPVAASSDPDEEQRNRQPY